MIPYQMLYAMAVGLPTLLAASLGARVLRGQARPERWAWLGALVLALTLPLVALVGPGERAVAAPVTVAQPRAIGLPAVVAVPAVPSVPVPVAPSARLGLDALLIGLWLVGSSMLAVRWAVAAVRLRRATRSCPSTTVDGVRVTLTSDLGPGVAGVVEPRVLAPRWLLSLPGRQRALVLEHEQEHIRARDPWLVVASRLARTLAPWNPFVWLMSARLLRAVELDCDRRVLRRYPDVEAYGLTLLTVSSRQPGTLSAAAFAESEAHLRRRILAMTTPPGTVSIVGVFSALVLGALLILGAFEVPIPTFRPDAVSVAQAPGSAGTITGVVRDGTSDRPIQHVQISLPGSGLGTLTDQDGLMLLLGVPAGEHRVVAERIGYRQVAETVTVAGGSTTTLDFRLTETAVPVHGTFVTDGRIDASASTRSGTVRAPSIFVDGVGVRLAGASLASFLDRLAEEREIERVDVVEGPDDAELGAEATTVQITLAPQRPDPTPTVRRGLPGRPVFTPHSVAPRVLNVEEVRRAMVEAYPRELRGGGIGGTVEVYFFVDERGTVQDFRIDRSSGLQALDRAALAVAGVYRFWPALNRDEPVPVWVRFPITFVHGG